MLTLEEALANQNDLVQLCRDRPLETNEVFTPNAFYGMGSILKMHAGCPQSLRLKTIIPHGICFDEDYVWESEIGAHLPAVHCYPPYRESAYTERTDKCVVLSASPFLYLLELLKGDPQPKRSGTIFFPPHSTHYLMVQMDHEALAEGLTLLDGKFEPVTVCMYWRDIDLGYHTPFEERGLRVVSAGHMYDPLFLFRFYHLCSMHLYAASNELGSHLFYSIKAGCSFFLVDPVDYSVVADRQTLKRDYSGIPPAKEATLRSLFDVPEAATTEEQMEVVDYYLGAEYLNTPDELREQLLQAEKLDKFGFYRRGEHGKTLNVPTFYRRLASAAKRRGLGGVRRLSDRLAGVRGDAKQHQETGH